jgi:hypothetical protein
MVKQLAIEDHDDIPILISHRLLAIREADNAQPARGQRDARLEKEALFVRAAMHYGTRHSPHDFVRHGSLLSEINNACDAAHENFLYFVRRPLETDFFTFDLIRRGEVYFASFACMFLQDAQDAI